MADDRTHTVAAPDGRTLAVLETGDADGPAVVAHHGTPGCGRLYRTEAESAERLGLRLIAYDRPGYGGSTPRPGRRIADCAADVAAILDALGVERFATYGTSGGGPHALACAARLPDRCVAAATLAGVGPNDAPDLDFLAGMGEGNQAEFGAAAEGRDAVMAYCERDAEGIRSAGPDGLAEAIRPHLSEVDAAALTGEFAAFMHAGMVDGLAPGVDGWADDDLAFLAPWGFDVAAIEVPVLIRQGEQDLMVPGDHGRWLRDHVAGADGEILAGEGHLTLFVNRIGDIHGWLRDRL
jgi:pimeloyl-ACP methyl ester carboxylesterase